MSAVRCADPIPLDVLVDYWLADPPREDAEALERHLFACARCSAALETVSALAGAIRDLGRAGRLRGGVAPGILGRLERDRRVVRRYRAEAGGLIQCTAGAEDDLVALELGADLEGIERIDLLWCAEDGTLIERAEQLPVIGGRTVLWAESADVVRRLPSGTFFLRLLAVGPAGERQVAEYTLDHTAYRA